MTDDRIEEAPEADTAPPEHEVSAASAEAPEAAETGETAPAEGAEAPAQPSEGEDVVTRPREVIRGISPELLCQCPECEPEFTELQWFTPEEQRKVKGQVMLFCARSGRKYFSQAPEMHAWIAEHAAPKKGRRAE